MLVLKFFVVLCFSGKAFAQIAGMGPCPKMSPMKNFDISKYMGTFYEFERYGKPDEELEKCAISTYKPGKNGATIQVETSTCALTGIVTTVPTYVKVDSTKAAYLTVKLIGRRDDVTFIILNTDYTSYSILYDCDEDKKNSIHYKYAWVYTRAKNPPAAVIAKINKLTDGYKFARSSFTKIQHADCEIKPPK